MEYTPKVINIWELGLKLLLALLLLAYLLYKYSSRHFNYWKNKGVPFVKPLPFIGNLLETLTFKKTFSKILATYYTQFQSRCFGIFLFDKPFLVIRDPSLAKRILIKDFRYFTDRSVICDEKYDSIASNILFFTKNPNWKDIRSKTSPIFTTGKMKNMFSLIKSVGNDMMVYLNRRCEEDCVETSELCGKYVTEIIATCAFGIKGHCFDFENAPFRQMSRRLFGSSWLVGMNQVAYFIGHIFVKLFKMPFFEAEVSTFLRKAFWEAYEERNCTKLMRNDVIDALKQLKDIRLEGDQILAQAVQFFSAGFETTSATLAFALYELSLNSEIQERLRLEIKETLLDYDEVNLSMIQNMKYLSMVVNETLRKYPILPFVERKCVANYEIPEESFVVDKGTPIYIPLVGLHYDPEYFPNPNVFNPERFSDGNEKNSFHYLPFGEGPRKCIGERFSLMAIKSGIVEILSQFKLQPTSNTPPSIHFSPYSFFLSAMEQIPLKFHKINLIG